MRQVPYLIGLALLLLLGSPLLADPSKTRASFAADVTAGFVPGDPVASLSFAYSQRLQPLYGFYFTQALLKNFYVDPGQADWSFNDSSLGLLLFPKSLIPGVTWQVKAGLTLPLSQYSRDNQIYSRPEVASTARISLTEASLIGLGGFGRYLLSQYQSTAGEAGQGGEPLVHYAYGVSGFFQQNFAEAWGGTVRATYFENKYYAADEAGLSQLPLLGQPTQGYSLNLSIEWQIDESLSLSAGLIQGSVLEQPGLADYRIFDEEATQWSIGVSYQL